jgi:hypothetical protein
MSLSTAYLATTKNLEAFLNAIKTAKAPERVNSKFLANLEFNTTNDRLFIGLLKGLSLVDDSGVPTNRYFEFLDQTRSGAILAEAIREAYSDLFAINTKAQDLSVEEVKNKLRTLTQGQNSDNVLGLMAKTFKALTDLADWTAPSGTIAAGALPPLQEGGTVQPEPLKEEPRPRQEQDHRDGKPKLQLRELHYNIQIVLPESRDVAVFDAIFESLRRHLL